MRAALSRVDAADAQTLWVDAARGQPHGDGSAARPFATISAAVHRAAAGTTIRVAPGRYTETVRLDRGGAPRAWLRLIADPAGKAVIDGEGRRPGPNWEGLVTMRGVAHIEIVGFQIVRSTAAGVFVDCCSDIVIRGVSTFDTWSSGLQAWRSVRIAMLGNTVRRACQGRTQTGEGTQECITLASCTNSEIAFNHVFDRREEAGNGGEGIDCKQACWNVVVHHNLVHHLVRLGIYVDAYDRACAGVRIASNVVHDCASGVVLSAERRSGRLTDVEVLANTAFDNRYHGIEVSDYDDDAPRARIRIMDNRLWNNGRTGWGGGISVLSRHPESGDIRIEYNLCSNNVAWQICVATGLLPRVRLTGNRIHGYRGYNGGGEREMGDTHPAANTDPGGLPHLIESAR
ncbi:MAG: right-handed parallel beta-helix repeat-containing protein [Kiritimatiellae bacterium]|nr:right-handed parallel beta-helix repeat-containing protein [Kiritimatiellia bacterium]